MLEQSQGGQAVNTIEQLKQDIQATEAQIEPLNSRPETLRRALRDEESKAFIAVNNICLEDVQMSTGKRVPWFGNVGEFAIWLAARKSPRWCEWNGMILRTEELCERMFSPTHGRIEHLKSRKAKP